MHLFYVICLSLVVWGIAPLPAQGRALSVDDRIRIQCAQERMRMLVDWFDVTKTDEQKRETLSEKCSKDGKAREFVPPTWFRDELERMEANKVLSTKKEDGSYVTNSEADLWKQAFANIGSFLVRADHSLDPSQVVDLEHLSYGFVNDRIWLVRALDLLNKDLVLNDKLVTMKDSMEGRGRAMLATLELINSEMFSTIEAFSSPISKREDKYRQSVTAVVVLSNNLFKEFRNEPIQMGVPKAELYQTTKVDTFVTSVMLLFGAFLAGLAAFLLLEGKRDTILRLSGEYRQKSLVWAEDFNRQFVTLDIKYIVLGTVGIFGLFGLLLGWTTGGFFGVFLFLVVVFVGAVLSVRMPMAVLDALKKSRGRKINAQLMDSLILLSNSLRAGMDIVQGFEMVSKDMLPPIADEFGLVVKNYKLGTPFEKALDGLTDRVDSRLLSYIVKAIIIQRQVGGNLTVIFARLVENIREESKLEDKLQAMTAQQKLQSIVVSVMPFVMMVVMCIFNPEQMISFYTSSLGLGVLLFCIIWIGIGMKILKKIGEVRV